MCEIDDMTQLNERFIKARRDYEALLEASMSHPPQSAYGRPNYTYNAPPPQQSYGAPPPQQGGGYGYQQPPPSDPRFQSAQQIPQNGPQPFYFVPPDQNQGPPPRASSAVHPAAAASTDDLYTHPGAPVRTGTNDPRRQTIAFGTGANQVGIPQELATGSFDSPVSSHHDQGHAPPPQQDGGYQAYAVQPGKAPSDPYAQSDVGGGYQQGQGRPPVPGGLASLPSQQPTSPVYSQQGNNPYGQAGQYTAYNPSVSAISLAQPGGPGSGYPRTAGAAGGSDESYYR